MDTDKFLSSNRIDELVQDAPLHAIRQAIREAVEPLVSELTAVKARADAAEAQIVAAWNAFANYQLADTAEEVYFQFGAADGDIAEQITALTRQRDTAEASLAKAVKALEAVRFNLINAGYEEASIMIEGIDAILTDLGGSNAA